MLTHRSTAPALPPRPNPPHRRSRRRLLFGSLAALLLLAVLALAGALVARHLLRSAARAALPQTTGTLSLAGLDAPVTVSRDPHGIPSLHATVFPDLLFAQGFVTAQDRLFQMDTLRRHAAGELAEILGPRLLPHDRAQRVLSLGPAADRILLSLPPDQIHDLQRYADGVNAAITLATSGQAHAGTPDPANASSSPTLRLPLEFTILAYTPRPWTPRDSILISLVLFQDLTNSFPTKLAREALTARLAPTAPPDLRAQLLDDLYPVGSWRDHPPSQPATDLTTPTDFEAIPLDESQTGFSRLTPPAAASVPSPRATNPVISTEAKRSGETPVFRPSEPAPAAAPASVAPATLGALTTLLAPVCPECRAGSNNWAVSGAHTASGKPILSNDMHLALTAPGIWYALDLSSDAGPTAAPFHVAGVSLPGTPWIVVGHNDHVAWGFTNLGADVQDLYREHLRGTGTSTEFERPDGSFAPVHHRSETIRVRGARNLTLDVLSTVHGTAETPLINPLLLSENSANPSETGPIALRWSLFDTAAASLPFAAANAASSAPALAEAFRTYSGPAQNLIAADDAGHILYHSIGRIPIRGSLSSPTPLSPVPTDSLGPDAALHEWAGTIPYDQLPSTTDPAGGILATANARITPGPLPGPLPSPLPGPNAAPDPATYPFPIALNWAAPYRNERIWHLLTGASALTIGDMRRLQMDVFSDSDQRVAHRLAYAIDHTPNTSQRLKLAADLLRNWDGQELAGTPAPAINAAARAALWQLLLAPKLTATATPPPTLAASSAQPADLTRLYTWGERDLVQEQLIAHMPARWLPSTYPNWDSLLAAAVDRGLTDAHAPRNLRNWRFAHAEPTQLELALFAQSAILRRLIGLPTGTRPLDLSGNGNTIRQTHPNFGASERLSTDLADPAAASLVLPLGESGNVSSPFLLDQLPAWLAGAPQALPFAPSPASAGLTLLPR